jgi:hypothetical protein
MKIRPTLVLCATCLFFANLRAVAQDQYLFAYFKEPGNQGIYLALSRDGYHYELLNGGQPWVKPEQPGELMRDIFLTRGPDGKFHMVWTWNWRGRSLGYAESDDLTHWSTQTEVPIMANFPETRNVWAPETDWDAQLHTWVLFWSSSRTDVPDGNRIWATHTTDFKTFTKPAIFFDPGYEVIDATMFHGEDKEYLVFKDQTRDPLRYQVSYATGPTVEGPWSDIHAPVTESWSEGASALQIGDEYVIFYDHYRAPHARYEGVRSRDWIHWENIDDRVDFPADCKHGSFLRVTAEEGMRLRLRHDPEPAKDEAPAPAP